MKRQIAALSLAYALLMIIPLQGVAAWQEDSRHEPKHVIVQDILLLLLSGPIEKAVNAYYSPFLTDTPMVYPYQVDVVKAERINGFHFRLTLETTPVVGPHISVGKDRLTFEIAPTIPEQVKLEKYEHLETHELPPHWQHIIRKDSH